MKRLLPLLLSLCPCGAMVSLIDLFPTICQAAGVDVPQSRCPPESMSPRVDVPQSEVPRSVDGRSLLGLYRGDDEWPRSQVFASFHSPERHHMSTRCIRTRRYKLIQHLLTGEVELFDLAGDPHELNNLAGRAEHATLQRQLADKLQAWRQKVEHFTP